MFHRIHFVLVSVSPSLMDIITTFARLQCKLTLHVNLLISTEYNAKDFVSSGGLKELSRISVESSREDIRNLASKTLKLSLAFQAAVDAL